MLILYLSLSGALDLSDDFATNSGSQLSLTLFRNTEIGDDANTSSDENTSKKRATSKGFHRSDDSIRYLAGNVLLKGNGSLGGSGSGY